MNVSTKKVILLDRDGVLNVDLPRGVRSINELAMEKGAPAAVASLSKAGYKVLVITNQGAIGRGEVSLDEVTRINDLVEDHIQAAGGHISQFYVCPHRNEDNCDCRKPKPGLITKAQTDWQFNPAETWFVGDADRDVVAATAAGVRPALVRTGKGKKSAQQNPAVPAFDDLQAFVKNLLASEPAV